MARREQVDRPIGGNDLLIAALLTCCFDRAVRRVGDAGNSTQRRGDGWRP
jgi:hypothetical protein